MKPIETIRIPIHLNLLLAEKNMKENNLHLAMSRIQEARQLLEDLEALTEKRETNKITSH